MNPALRKILFVDRDGTLIEEPADHQVDTFEKFALLREVIPALLKIQSAGYALVMLSNQDGLGSPAFPQAQFHGPHQLLLQILASQGIRFDAVHIDSSTAANPSLNRKPNLGMVIDYLKTGELDLQASAVVGDRESDLELAHNMGVRGFRVGPADLSWPQIAQRLCRPQRVADIQRETAETRIRVHLDLDDANPGEITTGVGFLDHMLTQLSLHGGFLMRLHCTGDLHVCTHHSIEDCGLALGEALARALGDKRGIQRYGFVLPMDEAQARVALDLGGRSLLRFDAQFPRPVVGDMPTEMVSHFFKSFSDALGAALHISVTGDNTHHMVEACFKCVGRALRMAISRQGQTLPSSKGVL